MVRKAIKSWKDSSLPPKAGTPCGVQKPGRFFRWYRPLLRSQPPATVLSSLRLEVLALPDKGVPKSKLGNEASEEVHEGYGYVATGTCTLQPAFSPSGKSILMEVGVTFGISTVKWVCVCVGSATASSQPFSFLLMRRMQG